MGMDLDMFTPMFGGRHDKTCNDMNAQRDRLIHDVDRLYNDVKRLRELLRQCLPIVDASSFYDPLYHLIQDELAKE